MPMNLRRECQVNVQELARGPERTMVARKTVLTTGEVAKICNVAPRTVSKWFDSGQLRGYRIPGSKDRRIPIDQLVRFMRAHGIPLNGLESGHTRVMVVDSDGGIRHSIKTALEAGGHYEVATASSAIEAGAVAHAMHPHVIVVDVGLPDVNPVGLLRFCQSHPELQSTAVIAMGAGLSEAAGRALMQQGLAGWLCKPFETSALTEIIDRWATPMHTVDSRN
jgi:excisionase family DNA binding protein